MMMREVVRVNARAAERELEGRLASIPGGSEEVKRMASQALKLMREHSEFSKARDTDSQFRELVWPSFKTESAEATPIVKAPTDDGSISLDRLIEKAKEQGYTEIYHVYRYRDESRLAPDRLPEATLHAQNVDEAVKKLVAIAGYDEVEAELLGLDQFDAGTILNLCDRLKELTGDTYSVSPYEMPHEP